jgi:hypothetical protein
MKREMSGILRNEFSVIFSTSSPFGKFILIIREPDRFFIFEDFLQGIL